MAWTLLAGAGCDDLRQMFWNTWLDPSQPIMNADLFKPSTLRRNGLREVISLNDQPLGNLPKNATDPLPEDLEVQRKDYRVAPGDQILIEVYELFEIGTATTVRRPISDTGYIILPKIAPLSVAGLTEREIAAAIAKTYRDAGVLQEPQVTVETLTRLNQMVSLVGAFGQQGAYQIPYPGFRMIQALGLGGGVANVHLDFVYVMRAPPQPEHARPEEAPAAPSPPPGMEGVPEIPSPAPEPLPLPLPGGPAEGPVGLDASGPGLPGARQPPTTAPPANGSDQELRDWRPRDIPGPGPSRQPGEMQDAWPGGEPPGPLNANDRVGGLPSPGPGPAPPPGPADQGHWMIVDGKWTLVNQATKPNGSAQIVPAAEQAPRIIRIDLAALRAGEPRWNIVIRNGDVIMAPLPITGEFYVLGNVARPGVYSVPGRGITMTQAIAAAGWFTSLAIPSRVQLIRRVERSTSEMTLINVEQIVRGKGDDYVIKPDDIINVGTSGYAPFLAVVRNAWRLSYGMGFVYDVNLADINALSLVHAFNK